MPIFMIGCTLLYLDSRVRKEGFDVELLANRTLAQPPAPPPLYPSRPELARPELARPELARPELARPELATPELATPELARPEWTPAPQRRRSFSTSILGLDDYIPAPADPVPAPDAQFALEDTRKSCQWCGAETNVDDRFCRLCGSAFDQGYS